jgi:hypothetical protein
VVRPNGLVRQNIDEKLDAVLRAHGTANRRQDRRQDSDVRNPPPTDEPKNEGDGMVGVSTYVIHYRGILGSQQLTDWRHKNPDIFVFYV